VLGRQVRVEALPPSRSAKLCGVLDPSATLERVAANDAVVAYGVHETDADRSSFAVTDRDRGLYLLGADRLEILHRWQLGPEAIGAHAVRAIDRIALISESDAVVLMDADGRPLWRHRHPAWKHGGFDTGCVWFDDDGTPFAVVPASDYKSCEIVALSARDGTPTHRMAIPTAPAGIQALHQRGGWVGLSVGEGQDGAYAWWSRLHAGRLEVIDGGWTDEVLFDADAAGSRILTTPHATGAIKIRSFPRLEVLREIGPPPAYTWDFYACFAGAWIVARAHSDDGDDEILVAIDPSDRITTLTRTDAPICPGPGGGWISTGSRGIERWQLTAR
jgi:hypothetical protein